MKKIIKPTLVVAVLAVSAAIGYVSYNQYQNQQLAFANPLMVENIEALADVNGGSFRYPYLQGKPQDCTLYHYFNVNTKAEWTGEEENKSLSAELGWKFEKKRGMKDRCPVNKEGGCNPYSCQEIGYNAGSGLN